MTFGERLTMLREQNNLTRKELAKILNIAYLTLSSYETNHRFPDQEMLLKISNFFDVSLDCLFGRIKIDTDTNKHMTLGKKIKLLRKKKNLTQAELGQALNVVKSTISQYENNINKPDTDMLINIANYFNVSVDYLLGRLEVDTDTSRHMTLGEKIRKLRNEKKLTLKELGELLNLGESTMSMYENGKRSPDYSTLIKLADFFDVSIDYLLGRTDIRNIYSFSTPNIKNLSNPLLDRFHKLSKKSQDSLKECLELLEIRDTKEKNKEQ